MKNVLVFLAPGFEEIEATTIIDVLRRSNVDVKVVGLSPNEVEGAHAMKIIPDVFIDEVDLNSFDAIILPGGSPGYINLKKNKKVLATIKEAFKNNKLVAAICAAPAVLAETGILRGKKCTIYPGMEIELEKGGGIPQNKWVVEDGNIITSQGPATAILFALKLAEKLANSKTAEQVKERTLAMLVLKQSC
ncbi:MAG: DJ-1/PfpI family protein [Candidatus Bathyarchaeota archaeon]|jgi:4-methyl-5(b-hydroxyethyl)-thiazole monophosphate biosynthesis|nr:DJ-1/PfpI family protein [Candidatus Bathyarchaeota archaeon]